MQDRAMFKLGLIDRTRRMFAEQFEADGDGFLYRKYRKGAPIRVTSRERDDFVSAFERDYPRAYLAMIAGAVVTLLGLVTIAVVIERDLSKPVIYAAVGSVSALFLIAHLRVWSAPARALERRPAVGQERSRAEMRDIMTAGTSYRYYVMMLTLFLLLLFSFSFRTEAFSGEDMFLIAFYVFASATIASLILRKWRFDRRNRTS